MAWITWNETPTRLIFCMIQKLVFPCNNSFHPRLFFDIRFGRTFLRQFIDQLFRNFFPWSQIITWNLQNAHINGTKLYFISIMKNYFSLGHILLSFGVIITFAYELCMCLCVSKGLTLVCWSTAKILTIPTDCSARFGIIANTLPHHHHWELQHTATLSHCTFTLAI